MSEGYKKFEKLIAKFETDIQHQMLTAWIPPHCPECKGILSHYAFSQYRLICLKCGNVYEMQFKEKEKI